MSWMAPRRTYRTGKRAIALPAWPSAKSATPDPVSGVVQSCAIAILTGCNALELLKSACEMALIRVPQVKSNLRNCQIALQQRFRAACAYCLRVDMDRHSYFSDKDMG
jgi:hypothetical protein